MTGAPNGLLALLVRLRTRSASMSSSASGAQPVALGLGAGCRRKLNCAKTASSSAFQSHSSDATLGVGVRRDQVLGDARRPSRATSSLQVLAARAARGGGRR